MAARWRGDDPRFTLGAMLPDFARMCGGRLVATHDDEISAGVSFHHRSDAIFHETPTFLALCASARTLLGRAGVRRACALAAAHVGVELLLDGVWLARPGVASAYLEAIAYTQRGPVTALQWRASEHAARFEHMCARLSDAGIPDGYRDPDEVGRRLHRILGARPRLAPGDGDDQRLIGWARAAQADVVEAASTLESELRAGLLHERESN